MAEAQDLEAKVKALKNSVATRSDLAQLKDDLQSELQAHFDKLAEG